MDLNSKIRQCITRKEIYTNILYRQNHMLYMNTNIFEKNYLSTHIYTKEKKNGISFRSTSLVNYYQIK